MNLNNIKPIRPRLRSVRMGAVLTWAENQDEVEKAKAMIRFAPRVYIMSKEPIQQVGGIFWIKAKTGGLRELMANYMTNIPGNGVVILTPPNAIIGGDIGGLLDFVEDHKMGMAWAAFVRTPSNQDGAPKLFIMASSSMAYLLQDVPTTLGLDGDEWSAWMHKRLANLMMRPRYFEATQYGIAIDEPKNEPTEVLNAYEISPPPVDPQPVKVRKKRVKKS